MTVRILLLIGLVALAPPRLLAEEPSFAACAWIRAENDGSGAGFVVDSRKRWLVTCRHVAADRIRRVSR